MSITYKDEGGIQGMRVAGKLAAEVLDYLTPHIKPGITTKEIDLLAAECMHRQGTARTMQLDPHYDDVVAEVKAFLLARAKAAMAAGIDRSRIVLDPGFGFGKTRAHNVVLVGALTELAGAGFPILVGLSRKSLLGQFTGRLPEERLAASVTAAIIAVQKGAAIVRVHDVAATRDALTVLAALDNS